MGRSAQRVRLLVRLASVSMLVEPQPSQETIRNGPDRTPGTTGWAGAGRPGSRTRASSALHPAVCAGHVRQTGGRAQRRVGKAAPQRLEVWADSLTTRA